MGRFGDHFRKRVKERKKGIRCVTMDMATLLFLWDENPPIFLGAAFQMLMPATFYGIFCGGQLHI